jgi:Cu/Ag efflux protein CusF
MKSRVVALLALLAAAASCSSAKTYEMRGQILGINRDKMEILVKHDEIPGLMAAMTMPWKVQQAGMLDTLGPGDLIAAEIVVDNNQGVITKITKVGTAKPDTPAPAAPRSRASSTCHPAIRCPIRRSSIRTGVRWTSTAFAAIERWP